MNLWFFNDQTPSLPQNDKSSSRATQLKLAKLEYLWDYNTENLPGIPMFARTVLFFRQFPSLKWLIKALEIGAQTIENSLADNATPNLSYKKQANCTWANLYHLILSVLRIVSLSRSKKAQATSASESKQAFHLSKLPLQLSKAAWSTVFSRNSHLVGALTAEYGNFAASLAPQAAGFKSLFKTIPLPATAQQLFDDDAFARFRLAGPNPMLLQGITTLPAKFPVTEQGYQQAMPGDHLKKALKENRVYVLDYAELDTLANHPGAKTDASSAVVSSKVYAPIALFALTPDRKQLKAVAIQDEQDSAKQSIVYATNDVTANTYWDWQASKAIVQNADANYHELLAHLARTHLLVEAFAVATPRYLAKNHPLYVLLKVHFEGTLFINDQAEERLVAKDGNVAQIFGADIQAVQAAAGQDRLNLDFYAAMLPNDLARRHVANENDLPDYPYRDDALLLWNAIQRWVSAYLAIYYPDDAAVLADLELDAWTKALIREGKVRGFRDILDRPQLSDVITMIIFTASVQHAAVNFPQSQLMSYLPVFPGSLTGAVPSSPANETGWFSAFPPLFVAKAQLDLFHTLGSVYYTKLGEYRKNRLPYGQALNDVRVTQAGGPLQQFKQNLQNIERTIEQRNQTRIPYTFLLPSNIPASINI